MNHNAHVVAAIQEANSGSDQAWADGVGVNWVANYPFACPLLYDALLR